MNFVKIIIVTLLLAMQNGFAEDAVTHTVRDKDLKWSPCPDIFPKGCELSVLHGDPAKPGTDIFFKVPGKYVIPPHTHTSEEHMTLIQGSLNVKYKDQSPVKMKEGTYAFGPAELPHEAVCESKTPCVLFIHFDRPIDAKPYTNKL